MIDKKSVKQNYKDNPPPMGIYQIKNILNGKVLIGSAKNLHAKSNSFKFQLKSNTHINSNLQQEYRQFGDENFVFEILDILEPKEDLSFDYTAELALLEEMWIEKVQPFGEKGYNKKK